MVNVFRTSSKDQVRHYAVYLPDAKTLLSFGRDRFPWLHDLHWQKEPFQRCGRGICPFLYAWEGIP